MVHHYGVCLQGAYHVQKNIVCQDAYHITYIDERFVIGAVADGLGSELYTDVASKIAVEKSVEYCAGNIKRDDSEDVVLRIIKEAFRVALDAINGTARDNGHDIDQYDTTLALAVYCNGHVYFGNSGDSGIVILNQDGTYESITTQQRDENGCVFPLFFGEEKWEFGSKKNVASVFLATDGMYETLFPYLLQGTQTPIYIALAHYLMSEESLKFSKTPDDKVEEGMLAFVQSIPGDQVSDDKTILVMLDTEVPVTKQPPEYYQAPDWAALKKKRDEEYRRAAYPHLFKD